MKSRWARLGSLLAMGVLSLALLAACASDGDADEDDADAAAAEATATEEASEAGEATTVEAVLTEFAIDLDASTAPAGEVTFNAENAGALPHEVIFIRSDEDPGSLEVDGAQVDVSSLDVVGEISEFAANGSESGALELEAGNYILICNIAGHYAGGMFTGFTVE